MIRRQLVRPSWVLVLAVCALVACAETDASDDAGADAGSDAAMHANGPSGEGTLFWLDILGNQVLRSDADGGGQEVIVSGGGVNAPDGVAVDAAGGKVYWSNMGSFLGLGVTATVQRANIDGSDVETLIEAGEINTAKQMQLDLDGGHLYVCDREGARLWRADLDGGNLQVIASAHDFIELIGVALDVPNRQLYFTDRQTRRIHRMGMDMPDGEQHDTRTDIETLFELPEGAMPIDLDLDLSEGLLYWTDRSLGTVERAPLELPDGVDPADRTDIETLVTGLGDAIGISLDLDQGQMYFTELFSGQLSRANLDGSEQMVITDSGSATGVAFTRLP